MSQRLPFRGKGRRTLALLPLARERAELGRGRRALAMSLWTCREEGVKRRIAAKPVFSKSCKPRLARGCPTVSVHPLFREPGPIFGTKKRTAESIVFVSNKSQNS